MGKERRLSAAWARGATARRPYSRRASRAPTITGLDEAAQQKHLDKLAYAASSKKAMRAVANLKFLFEEDCVCGE